MQYALILGLHHVLAGPIYKDLHGIWRFVFNGLSIDEVAQPGDKITIFDC